MVGCGRVVETKGNQAYVMCVRESACGEACVHCKICETKGVKVCAENKIGARKGDFVRVEANTKNIMFLSFFLYILPVILFFSAIAVGGLVLKSEIASAVLTLLSFLIWFVIIKILAKKEVKHTVSEVLYHRA